MQAEEAQLLALRGALAKEHIKQQLVQDSGKEEHGHGGHRLQGELPLLAQHAGPALLRCRCNGLPARGSDVLARSVALAGPQGV